MPSWGMSAGPAISLEVSTMIVRNRSASCCAMSRRSVVFPTPTQRQSHDVSTDQVKHGIDKASFVISTLHLISGNIMRSHAIVAREYQVDQREVMTLVV